MAIRNRRGVYTDFDKTKMVDGEFAVVKSGDPDGSGKAVYISFESGTADRLALFEDLEEYGGKIDAITVNGGEELPIDDKTVDIPIPTVDISAPTGDIVEFSTGGDNMPMKAVEVSMSPIQDLNGYSSPWPAGGWKNKLPNTAVSKTENGITFTVNADGSVTVNGTATAQTNLVWPTFSLDGEYILSGCPSGGGASKYYLAARIGNSWNVNARDMGSGVTISGNITDLAITIVSGQTLSNAIFKPMLRLATETDDTYAPYSNICPISGRTGASVVVVGKNLFADKGQGYWRVPDGAFITAGTTTQRYRSCEKIPVIAGAQYTGFVKSTYDQPTSVYVQWWGADGTGREVRVTQWPVVAPDDAVLMSYAFRFESPEIASTAINVIQVEAGSTPTEYEENKTTTYPITFTSAGTVYAGTVDLVSGELVVTHGGYTFTGDETFGMNGGNTNIIYFNGNSLDRPMKSGTWTDDASTKCSHFEKVISNADFGIRFGANSKYIYFYQILNTLGIASIADWKTWLASNNVQITYPLETPLTYTLTPTQVMSLLGENVMWSPDGTISNLKYSADISLVVADLYSKLSS